jgi:tRNA threonylcarbamoyladenosine biosynthesis protein TsaE
MSTSNSLAETKEAGAKLAPQLRRGDVLALVGDLGSGKTEFVKGVARGLGAPGPVTSSTFTLVHEYAGGRLPLYHFDFYRVESVEALRALDFDEYFSGSGVSVIEWADKFPDAIPQNARWIKLTFVSQDMRRIEIGTRESALARKA